MTNPEKREVKNFKDDRKKWDIHFDIGENDSINESVVEVRFRRNGSNSPYISENDLKKLEQDLKDLGKFRVIKQGKEFLKNE